MPPARRWLGVAPPPLPGLYGEEGVLSGEAVAVLLHPVGADEDVLQVRGDGVAVRI